MIAGKLRQFLEENNVYYGQQSHDRCFSAESAAAAVQIPPEDMAKTVMVKLDGRLAMAVVRANERVDTERLRKVAGAENIELAKEREFTAIFDDCERGAMPPFGHLYSLPEFVDVNLGNDDTIAFNGGNHSEVVLMPYKIFERLANPVVARIAH